MTFGVQLSTKRKPPIKEAFLVGKWVFSMEYPRQDSNLRPTD